MARHALTPTCLKLVQALESVVPAALAESGFNNVRIGLSWGADSLALTAAAVWARDHRRGPLAGISMSVRVVDHGLQSGSADIARTAADQAEQLGVAADIVRVAVDPTGVGVEAAARESRYAALSQGGDALILLAHTLDDQAETVLLGLARGSGVRSLSGMAPVRGRFVRPFLTVRRTDTEQACRDWGLAYWTDPTNSDPSYTRSRLRSAMSTLDSTLGPGFADALARTADLARIDADYIDDQVQATGIDTSQPTLSIDSLASIQPAIRHRILLVWLRTLSEDQVTRAHVLCVDSLITDWHGQKSIPVPRGQVVRKGIFLQIEPLAP